ncbi:DUF1868 domain-containing protein [Sphingomonas crocodyli]|uniref:DUF1868 domain-containing protein n=1 Tax=Sphingomonas crocodyli TaxID=1979270 RepID=A0A437M6Y3_9SPHN|nr:DUF1868 domain-containing protein [Sphingomonas crocodyli]RVT93478.1 DUF1868 domain-containing protein [Sphingomonas crocodyli]
MTKLSTDRRHFLELMAAGATAIVGASNPAQAARGPYPPDVGSKFYADGRVHPFAGNTVICHVPQQGEHAACFDALLDIYREAPKHAFLRKVALLPPSSYHMTVFGGANDRPRLPKSWPADLSLDMPMAQCTEILTERLKTARIDCRVPIKMRVDPSQDPTNGAPLTLRLLPADAAEHSKLAELRRAIADATKIPLPAPDTYRFHISLGYFIAWLNAAEEASFITTFNRWAHELAAKSPVITLGAPEFCTFHDMFAFHRILYLAAQTGPAQK